MLTQLLYTALFVNQTGLNFLPCPDVDFRPQFAKKAPPLHALHPLSQRPGWVYECTLNMSSFHALMICTHPPSLPTPCKVCLIEVLVP